MTPIIGFPGYFITRTGEVWSEKKRGRVAGTGSLHRLKPQQSKSHKGRLHVGLHEDGKNCFRHIHRLMAETFLAKPLGATLVRHLDDDVSNNDIANLAWGTAHDNHMDAFRNQILWGCQKLMPVDVIFIRERRRRGATAVELAAMYGMSRRQVVRICGRGTWKHLP